MISINPQDFVVRINELWKSNWFLLTSGNFEKNHFNTMTVAWGYFGIMWNRPIAVVVVRPTRFTYKFTEKYGSFTLTSFDKSYKKDLLLLGTKSGRDGDKIAETGLTTCAAEKIDAPSFKEAVLSVECTKIYRDVFKPENFLDPTIDKNYPFKDYHIMYFGEIIHILGTENFLA
jgi:flavin reductase (DIM6/NTAB) family NADH-FMN oxidoreductase RutF